MTECLSEAGGNLMRLVTRIQSRGALRALVLFLLVCVTLAGCNVIQIPPITFTIPLMSGVSIPGLGALASSVTVQDEEFPLPLECGLPEVAELRQEIVNAVGEALAGLITIDSLNLTKVVFTATQGEFSSLTKIRAVMRADGIDYDMGTAESPTGLGAQFELTPPAAIDLLTILNAVDCIRLTLFVDGSPPETALTFGIDAELEVTASLF